ncbi:hypothetical protein LTR86_000036 [Recurvomyces mirabilis]|nr:hypothetical protein LTR86_000036 [Recurvomyces mirabilis]
MVVCSHLVTIYFDYVHDQLHTLFQKPGFMADMSMNQISPAVMFGVVALSARFSSHEYFTGQSPRSRGVAYARQAAALFDPSVVSLTSIQTAVLLGACRIVEGDAHGESIYYGIGCRMAQLLDLPHRSCATRLEREINIRVWYTLCMIDEWSSTGVGVPKQITSPPTDIALPCEEMAFLQLRFNDFPASASPWDEGISTISSTSSLSSSSSLLAQMILLNRILSDVNKLNKRSVDDRMLFPDDEAVHALLERLDAWEAELPPFMRDDRSNLAHYAGQGLGRIFVAVYLGYYHFGQLLFYQYLHGASDEMEGITSDFPRHCKYHAAKLCNMVYAALDTPGCDVLYNMVGHVLVVASTVQIHTVLFSTDDNEIAAARQRLERNYTILLRLRDLWPSLDFCMMRLQAFHKACRSSMDTSFRLDRWMLTFLSEFAKPVDDQPTEADWAIGDIAITPRSDFGFNPTYFEELMGP